VVTRDQDDGGIRQRLAQALKLTEGKNDGGVGGADRVKKVSRDHHHIGSSPDHPIDGGAERLGDIGFPLIDAARGLPVVLPDAKMRIGDVGEFHGWRMNNAPGKGKRISRKARRRA